jgi:hypothetical protein
MHLATCIRSPRYRRGGLFVASQLWNRDCVQSAAQSLDQECARVQAASCCCCASLSSTRKRLECPLLAEMTSGLSAEKSLPSRHSERR